MQNELLDTKQPNCDKFMELCTWKRKTHDNNASLFIRQLSKPRILITGEDSIYQRWEVAIIEEPLVKP